MAHHASLGSDGNLWMAYSNDYGPYNVTGVTLQGQVWKYNVPSGSWTNVTPSSNWGGMAGGISVDARNPQHAIVSTLDWYAPDRILSTADGGTDWTVIALPPTGYTSNPSQYLVNGIQWLYFGGNFVGTNATNWVEAVCLDPFNSNRAFYGTGEGIFVSTDIQASNVPQSVTWSFLDRGLEETVPLFLPGSVKGAFLSAVGDIGGMRNDSLTAPATGGMYTNPVFSNTVGLDFAENNPNLVARIGTRGSGNTGQYGAYSTDNGQTWTPFSSQAPDASRSESVAVAADGSVIVLSTNSGVYFSTNNGSSWTTSSGLPSNAMLASDRSSPSTFYATSGGTLYVSSNSATNFAAVNSFYGSGVPRACFGEPGEVWVAANGGNLYQFTGAGTAQNTISSVSNAWGVGFGMPAPGKTHPAVFIIGSVNGQYGFYRCDDGVGTTWVRINDDQHQYGWLQNNYIAGDEIVFSRVYLTTGGRGYIYGVVPSPTPTPTDTPTPCGYPGNTCTPTATPTPTNTFLPVPGPGLPLIYPNPLKDQGPLRIFVPFKSTADVKVEVFTTSFRKVLDKKFPAVSPGVSVKLDPIDQWGKSLADGLYYVVVTTSLGDRRKGKWLILR